MPSTCVRRRSLSWANLLLAKRPKRPQPSVSLCIEQKASMESDEPPRRQRVCCTSLEVDDKAGFGRGTGRAPGRSGMLRANEEKCLAVVIHFRRDIFRAGLRQDRLPPRCSTAIPGALHWVPWADAADERLSPGPAAGRDAKWTGRQRGRSRSREQREEPVVSEARRQPERSTDAAGRAAPG